MSLSPNLQINHVALGARYKYTPLVQQRSGYLSLVSRQVLGYRGYPQYHFLTVRLRDQ